MTALQNVLVYCAVEHSKNNRSIGFQVCTCARVDLYLKLVKCALVDDENCTRCDMQLMSVCYM